ncbi:MAG: hypothetical protein JWM55_152 [Acidimicrobiaceae bacterium]|nr:hypothetical protein [Acidimicrobiaceae bacterium]
MTSSRASTPSTNINVEVGLNGRGNAVQRSKGLTGPLCGVSGECLVGTNHCHRVHLGVYALDTRQMRRNHLVR